MDHRLSTKPARRPNQPKFYNYVTIPMLAHAFPNLEWLKKQANTSFADRKAINGKPLPVKGWPNVIMNAKASGVVRDGIKGPLSIFANISGQSAVTVERYRIQLQPGTFFLSNAGQFYTLEIGKTSTETANIHFGKTFSEGAFRSLKRTPDQLLESETDDAAPTFYNRVIRADETFEQLLKAALRPGISPIEEEQVLFDILGHLMANESQLRNQEEKLSALKRSTKTEIMRRLLLATDYLHSVTNSQPDLEELARISCLSKFHFLRLFKIAFGQTPHQFLTTLKLQQAKDLLQHSQHEVKTIATSLGYKDASTFSRQFYQHIGVYPSQFRASC